LSSANIFWYCWNSNSWRFKSSKSFPSSLDFDGCVYFPFYAHSELCILDFYFIF
jgi:hypothetical protein